MKTIVLKRNDFNNFINISKGSSLLNTEGSIFLDEENNEVIKVFFRNDSSYINNKLLTVKNLSIKKHILSKYNLTIPTSFLKLISSNGARYGVSLY